MRRLLAAVFILAVAVAFVGCANAVPAGVDIQVAIANAFPQNFVHVGGPPITLKAMVNFDGSHQGVKWALTAANVSCSPACGKLVPDPSPSFTAVYTPPTTLPLNQQATITAISVAERTQDFAFTFSIIPPASIQITDKFASLLIGSASVEVNAAVTNDPTNAGATWTLTVNGSNCSPACGTLSTAGPGLSTVYNLPPTFPTDNANANPTITATSVANTAASDSFSFTIVNTTTFFKGDYAFLLRGYYNGDLTQTPQSAAQVPMAVAGRFTADGNGNITNAELDFNNSGGITNAPAPQTGTYTVTLGPTGIVEAVINIASFTFSSGLNPGFRCIMSADGTHGRMIELDQGAFLNSGTIELQDTTVTSAKPAGNFAFGVDSDSPFGGRTIAAGQLVLAASGVTGGLIDQSVQANLTPTFVAQPLSADSQTAPDSVGRGTLNITAQGKTVLYAYYVVDSSHFNLIEIDPGSAFGTVFAGVARSQTNLTSDSVNGVNVIQLTGFDADPFNPRILPVVLVGLLTVANGNSQFHSYVLNFDINDIGNVLQRHGASGDVAFDPATGRAAVTSPDGFGSNFVSAGAWYLYDKGKGFFVEEDISTTPTSNPPFVTNRALSGTTLPQLGAPYELSALSGNVLLGSGASSIPLVPNAALGVTIDSPTGIGTVNKAFGTYSAVGDLTSIATQGGKFADAKYTGSIAFLSQADLSIGYGQITIPAPLVGDFVNPNPYPGTFYMIAPNQFVAIVGQPSTPVNTGFGNTPPFTGVIFVGP